VTRKRRRGIFHALAALLLLGTIAIAGVRPVLTWYFPLKYRESVEKNAHSIRSTPC